MNGNDVKLSVRHKWWLRIVGDVLFVTGSLWVLFDWLGERGITLADLFSSLKPWLLKIHGAAAMAFLVAMGILIPTHIARGWGAGRNRVNGVFFTSMIAMMVATGYGLYYFGDEGWRNAAHWIHICLGFSLPILLLLHITLGRRTSPASRTPDNARTG